MPDPAYNDLESEEPGALENRRDGNGSDLETDLTGGKKQMDTQHCPDFCD